MFESFRMGSHIRMYVDTEGIDSKHLIIEIIINATYREQGAFVYFTTLIAKDDTKEPSNLTLV